MKVPLAQLARSLLILAGVSLAASTITACGVGITSRKRAPAFTASADQLAADERLLLRPFALAGPEDAIVRIVGPSMTCTGTAIDNDLILTAHHCLVERGPKGEYSSKLLAPSQIKVELGGDYFAWGEVSIRAIVAPPCGEGGGGGDIAVMVLSRKLAKLEPMTPRLNEPPKVGEEVRAAGFGRCALSADAIRRKERAGDNVREVRSQTILLDAAICPGDSGGPVFAKGTREIVGVVSQSAMDHDEHSRGASVMARVDAYRLVFAQARLIADGLAQNELPPLECSKDVERGRRK